MSNPSASILKSSKILPIRFYSELFQQDRFNKFHDRSCSPYISYPANELPAFQITREHSSNTVDTFVLKKVCNEDSLIYKSIPEKAAIFEKTAAEDFFGDFPIGAGGVFDNGVDPPFGTINSPVGEITECNIFKQIDRSDYPFYSLTGANPYAQLLIPAANATMYSLKIVVEKFLDSGTGFKIRIFNAVTGTVFLEISSAGVYNIDFTTDSNDGIVVEFNLFNDNDIFEISYLQVQTNPINSLSIGDLALDDTEIQIFSKADGTDILSWINYSQNNLLDTGNYYYVVKCGDDEYYYSEIFSIKKLKELQSFYKIEWYNTCSLFDKVIYGTGLTSSQFKNILYLDAALFKPEYDTHTDNETDGDNNNIPTFKKWGKFISLEIIKTPEFLADALSAIFLHDHITITEPLNKKQEVQNEFNVSEVVSNIEPIMQDEFQKVILRFLLTDYIVKAGCCEEIELDES